MNCKKKDKRNKGQLEHIKRSESKTDVMSMLFASNIGMKSSNLVHSYLIYNTDYTYSNSIFTNKHIQFYLHFANNLYTAYFTAFETREPFRKIQ